MPTEKSGTTEKKSAFDTIMGKLDSMEQRIGSIEKGGSDDFKNEAKEQDVVDAEKYNKKIPAKIKDVVDSMLGSDFKIELESFADKPGFMFHLIVPDRISEMPEEERPVVAKPGEVKNERGYKIDDSKKPVMEKYKREDRRSAKITDTNSIDEVKDHCERVRVFIIQTYQKLKKPLPEFKTT